MEGWFMAIDKKGTLDDLSLMVQGNISLLWIQACSKTENHDRKVGDLLADFRKKYKADINNNSLILMASYLFFVYPKEIYFDIIDYSSVDTSKFEVIVCEEEESKRDSKYICRRVRNALAHSNIHIDENMLITFEDDNLKKTDYFKCTIPFPDFGKFVNDFFFDVKDSFFNNRA